MTSTLLTRALSTLLLLSLPLISLYSASPGAATAHAESALQEITFTPHLTPIVYTLTPKATPIGTLEPQETTAAGPASDSEEPTLGLSGGDWEIGYDFVQTPDGPQWHLWLNGEVVIVNPDNPAVVSILDAFRDQADRRARANKDFVSAKQAATTAVVSAGGGLIAFAGGAVTGVLGCAGVPWTFWAVGGTGWICAGGIAAAAGGAITTAVSAVQFFQSRGDRAEAEDEYEAANQGANALFEALKNQINN